MKTGLPNDSARLILALGRQRTKMSKSWQRLAVELAIKAIYEYETGRTMEWATRKHKFVPRSDATANFWLCVRCYQPREAVIHSQDAHGLSK